LTKVHLSNNPPLAKGSLSHIRIKRSHFINNTLPGEGLLQDETEKLLMNSGVSQQYEFPFCIWLPSPAIKCDMLDVFMTFNNVNVVVLFLLYQSKTHARKLNNELKNKEDYKITD
jgi:hypothetical protein